MDAVSPAETPNSLPRLDTGPSAAPPARVGLLRRLARLLLSPFRGPRLPGALVLFAFLLILAEGGLSLINQPTDYWVDHNLARGTDFIRWLYYLGPAAVLAAYALYALVIAGLLRLFNWRLALIAWAGFTYYHLGGIESWLHCGFGEWFVLANTQTPCNIYSTSVTVLLAGTGGLLLTALAGLALPALAAASAPRRRSGRRLAAGALIAAVWIAGLGAGIVRSAQVPPYGWRPVASEHSPAGRTLSATAYDTQRQRAVLFGGAIDFEGNQYNFQNDTWEWDGHDWTQMQPVDSPPPRVSHDMAYDEQRGVVVLFGGYNQDGALQDTWEWDGVNWTQFCPACSPPAREAHQMVYDPRRGHVLVIGGYDHASVFFDDVWEWDGEAWSQIVFDDGSAPVASAHSSAYDLAHDRLVTNMGGYPRGTWAWEGDTWFEIPQDLQPRDRGSADLAYDASRQNLVLFGGIGSERRLGDTWVLTGDVWTEIQSSLHPAARWGHNLFYDPTRQRVMLFGGVADEVYENDLWELVQPPETEP